MEQRNPCDVATGENSASSMQATTLGEDESMQQFIFCFAVLPNLMTIAYFLECGVS